MVQKQEDMQKGGSKVHEIAQVMQIEGMRKYKP